MIYLAGVGLAFPDEDGRLQAWLDQYLALETLHDQAPTPVSLTTNRPQTRSGYKPGTGLALPNYPPPPCPKINSLYWPTGATRWARGYFLADGERTDRILKSVGEANSATSLVLQENTTPNNPGRTITASVHVLQAIPITSYGSNAGILYLLPVVCKRYYWQWRHAGNISVTNSSTWANMYSLLGTALGSTVNVASTVVSDYQKPDIDELQRKYENAAVMLDAVAHSVGQRIVLDLDGTVRALDNESSDERRTANEESNDWATIAGGSRANNTGSVTPGSVLVTFQKWRQGMPDPGGDKFVVTGGTRGSAVNGTVKVIHSSACADLSDKTSSTPANDANLTTLATRIAEDFYDSHGTALNTFNATFIGLKSWLPSGYDNHVTYNAFSVVGEAYQGTTEVGSLPANFGNEEQCQRFAGMTNYNRLARFKLRERLDPGGHADAYFVSGTDGETATTDELTVYDTEAASFGLTDEYGWAEYKDDSLQWEVVSMDGSLLRPGVTDGVIATGTLGDVSIGGELIIAKNTGADLGIGEKVFVFFYPAEGIWYVITAAAGGDTAIVTAKEADYREGYCWWLGQVALPNPDATGYCSDQFPDNTACWLVVLNKAIGSTGYVKGMLRVGEHYIGRRVATLEGGTDMYAVQVPENMTFPLTLALGSPLAPGASISSVTIPSGESVTIKNQSTDTTLYNGDKVLISRNAIDDKFYAVKSGGGSGKTWAAFAADDIAAGASGDVLLPDSSIGVGGLVTATNWSYNAAAKNGNQILVWVDAYDGLYYFVCVKKTAPRRFRGLLNAVMLSTDSTGTATSIVATDGDAAGITTVTIQNPYGLEGTASDAVLFEQDYSSGSLTYFCSQVLHKKHSMLQEEEFADGINFKARTRNIVFMGASAALTETTLFSTYVKTFVTNVLMASGSLKEYQADYRVFDTGTVTPTPSVVITPTSVLAVTNVSFVGADMYEEFTRLYVWDTGAITDTLVIEGTDCPEG